jgi:hypothetical protein
MMKRITITALVAASFCATTAGEDRAAFPPLVYATENGIVRFAPDGSIAWKYESGSSRDVWQLPSGNLLFPYNLDKGKKCGVMEVTPEKKVVFDYRAAGKVICCQRLADGNTLVGASGQAKILIVDPKGEIVREIKTGGKPHLHNFTMVRQLKDGNFLLARENDKSVQVINPKGKVLREIKCEQRTFAVIMRDNGNILVSGQHRIIEFDDNGVETWSLSKDDVKDMGVRWFAGMQLLPNGNLLVCNAGGKVPLFEVTRDKKIAWQSNRGPHNIPVGHNIHRTDLKREAKR